MSKIYQKYADYYDTLYQYKNYPKECDFLEKIFQKYIGKKSLAILDLGCGTGGHALILSQRGNRVTAVDFSDKMIGIAQQKAEEKKLKIDFKRGDIRNFYLKKKFDVVLLMFNVIGYQTCNQDLFSVFRTANRHLKKRGLLILDCWFGPAVLRQMPGPRQKVIKKSKEEKLEKSSTSFLNILNQTVDIKYQVLHIMKDRVLDRVKETHKIRFLFPQEIKRYLKETSFRELEICPFLKLGKIPTFQDWNITVIAKKI